MEGLAHKLYREKTRQPLRHAQPQKILQRLWPMVEALLDDGALSYIDYAIAENLLRPYPDADESAALFLCYLSQASRSGHLCGNINSSELIPAPKTLWQRTILKNATEINMDDLNAKLAEFETKVRAGAATIPQELLFCEEEEQDTGKPLCKCGNSYYFRKYWQYEKTFFEHLKRIQSAQSLCQPDEKKVNRAVDALLEQKAVLPEQASAIRKGCLQNFSIICGGPGTGKTYTAGLLINTYLQCLPEHKREKCKIALAAPTGKAAANLQKSLSRACGEEHSAKISTAQTLHSLLKIGKGRLWNAASTIAADLILVDESSMIDAHVITKLFAAIRPGAKLILLGDPNQLPPVESGLFFGDLVDDSHGVTSLTKCLRAELQTIVDAAEAIKCGDANAFLSIAKENNSSETVSYALYDETLPPRELQKQLLPRLLKRLPTPSEKHSEEELLALFNRYKVLSPVRKGPFGVDTLNALIKETVAKGQPKEAPLITPILIVSNDYRLELFNGETGVLIKRDAHSEKIEKGDIALFPGRTAEEPVRKLPALLLRHFEYAYCMSVHKSQGSEFNEVLVLLPEGSELFGREVLYTAATRAKQKLELLTTLDTLENTIHSHTKRQSRLLERLGNH